MRADARKNYDLLIEVARDVFVEQGAEASLRDIARRAGVGMGTLFCSPPILPRRCWSGWPRAWRLPISIAGSSPR